MKNSSEKTKALYKLNRCKEKETDSRAITFEEQKQILKAIENPKYKNFFFFCCATGMRACEALYIKTADIDKRGKIIKIKMRDTKTKKHKRGIPFAEGLFDGFDLSGKYLFEDITDDSSSQYFCNLYKNLGLDINRHSARHTFVSVCSFLGIPKELIQQWAGHTDLKMTTDTYTHKLQKGSSPILICLKKLKKSLKL